MLMMMVLFIIMILIWKKWNITINKTFNSRFITKGLTRMKLTELPLAPGAPRAPLGPGGPLFPGKPLLPTGPGSPWNETEICVYLLKKIIQCISWRKKKKKKNWGSDLYMAMARVYISNCLQIQYWCYNIKCFELFKGT